MHFTNKIDHTVVRSLHPSSHIAANRRAQISNQCQQTEHEWRQSKLPKGNLNCSCFSLHKGHNPNWCLVNAINMPKKPGQMKAAWSWKVKISIFLSWFTFCFSGDGKKAIHSYHICQGCISIVYNIAWNMLTTELLGELFIIMNCLLLCSQVFVFTI